MIDFNKGSNKNPKCGNTHHSVKVIRRLKTIKKITKSNKKFLQALGFKV